MNFFEHLAERILDSGAVLPGKFMEIHVFPSALIAIERGSGGWEQIKPLQKLLGGPELFQKLNAKLFIAPATYDRCRFFLKKPYQKPPHILGDRRFCFGQRAVQ